MEVIFSAKLAEKYPQFNVSRFVSEHGTIDALDLYDAAIERERILIFPEDVAKFVASHDLPFATYWVDVEESAGNEIAETLTCYLASSEIHAESSQKIEEVIKSTCELYEITLESNDQLSQQTNPVQSSDGPHPIMTDTEKANYSYMISIVLNDEDRAMGLADLSVLGITNATIEDGTLRIPVNGSAESVDGKDGYVNLAKVLANIKKIFKSVVKVDTPSGELTANTAFGRLLCSKKNIVILPELCPSIMSLRDFIITKKFEQTQIRSHINSALMEVR